MAEKTPHAEALEVLRTHGNGAQAYVIEKANEMLEARDSVQLEHWRQTLKELIFLIAGLGESKH